MYKSILVPPMAADSALKADSHGLVSRTSLQHEEVSRVGWARRHWTLNSRSVNVLPCVLTTKNVVSSLGFEDVAGAHYAINVGYIRTSLAEKSTNVTLHVKKQKRSTMRTERPCRMASLSGHASIRSITFE